MNLTLDDDSAQRLLEKLETLAPVVPVGWLRVDNTVPNLAITRLYINQQETNVYMLLQLGGRYVVALDTSHPLPVELA